MAAIFGQFPANFRFSGALFLTNSAFGIGGTGTILSPAVVTGPGEVYFSSLLYLYLISLYK